MRGPRTAEEALAWYESLFELIAACQGIKAVGLIAIDWRRLSGLFPHSRGFPDARLDTWPDLPQRYREKIAGERFIHADEADFTRWR